MNAAKTALCTALVAGLFSSCSSYKSLSAPPAMDAAGLVRDGNAGGHG